MATGIGIIGTGVISKQYFDTFAKIKELTVVAVADIDLERAEQVAAARGTTALTVEQLLADDRIEIVLNLTVPVAHAEVDAQIIAAGKHVCAEKPLALDLASGKDILASAEAAGVRVASAPDTFLGTGVQTSIDLVRSGRIGEPFAATALWGSAGPELWHPNPGFYFQPGGGPVLDMGPYYLTALVQLLGPVRKVQSSVIPLRRERVFGAGPNAGQPVPVKVDTAAAAILEHVGGAVTSVTLSFETWGHNNEPFFEVYGSAGSLRVPDPNWFDGTPLIYDASGVVTSAQESERDWEPVQPSAGFRAGGRGVGLLDLAESIKAGVPHRASGELALHVLEVMAAISAGGAEIASAPTPAPVVGLRDLN
ncbi:MAG: Gfo/Idh/MocA family oxidoreductase [Propionibacteriaceae bacterium]|jgi:predicted dehydrogenase|nr:Gfo/Idh/MocA family oxidoreductase [Propionibacteriaceae bacterium]